MNLNQALQTKFPHLEISCLKLSEVQKDNEIFRIDSEPFKKSNLNTNAKLTYIKLSQIANINPSKLEISNLDKNIQVTFLSMQNLGNGVINDKESGTIKDFENGYTYFSENDILIAKITPCMEHGKCAIAFGLNNKIGFGSTEINVFRIHDSRFLKEFVFCYLNREIIRKIAADNMVGTSGRQRVPTSFYQKLLIPLLPMDFQLVIQKLVKDSHFALEQSKELYKEAQNMLYIELGLNPDNPLQSILDFHPTPKEQDSKPTQKSLKQNLNISIRTLKESLGTSGRLDSEYYQSKYDAIEHKIKNYQGGWDCVKTFFIHNNATCDFSKDKYNYIEISDINISNGVALYNQVNTNELPANAKIKIAKNDILVSKVRPYRGAVAIIDFEAQNTIASGAFVVLREKDNFKKEVLQVLLRTNVYKEWLLKWNVGTSYPVIKDDDILNLPIPKIDFKTQEKIATLIQESFALRAKARALLEEAKIKVETKIKDASLK